jgi:hypothetical protein
LYSQLLLFLFFKTLFILCDIVVVCADFNSFLFVV